jgi:predicted NUDIX family NTP pyrophosphohydrolase
MARTNSAGLLLYRYNDGTLEVLLGHPGGPFWAKKDAGAWSIPKGEVEPGEDLLDAAKREFLEETGSAIDGRFTPLSSQRQPNGKLVHAFAVDGDFDPAVLVSGTFEMEWPPRSKRMIEVPELDRVAWFSLQEAATRILKGQLPFLEELASVIERAAAKGTR